eukprot:1332446-Alexandrium_andersonii.AAC.1
MPRALGGGHEQGFAHSRYIGDYEPGVTSKLNWVWKSLASRQHLKQPIQQLSNTVGINSHGAQ